VKINKIQGRIFLENWKKRDTKGHCQAILILSNDKSFLATGVQLQNPSIIGENIEKKIK